jgi:hypothetical protein
VTSERQLAANRRNAVRSTGPRTQAGKVRSAGNAFRHGLAGNRVQALKSPEIEKLTRLFAGNTSDSSAHHRAREAALAQLDIVAVRAVRAALLQPLMIGACERIYLVDGSSPKLRRSRTTGANGRTKAAKVILRLDRYEKRAFARRASAFRELDAIRP